MTDDGKRDEADGFEKLLALGLGIVAASVARKAVAGVWKASTGKTPPGGEQGEADGTVVLLWGAALGAAVGAARLLAQRQARAIARKRRS
ncbi:unannotated protein [freshwater metagenome]|uniref:Unannotated protein n=1 Tax=freshwater metagenome TaxID=449393 RepID=A0A6J7D2Q0_9ZZZZ|nr:DUF4235 domain-containing protein [Actinomycetota bacterium]